MIKNIVDTKIRRGDDTSRHAKFNEFISLLMINIQDPPKILQ